MKYPNVAGSYYPSDALALRQTVERMLADAETDDYGFRQGTLRALIVPHAGYIHSGMVAAHGYLCLKQALCQHPRRDLTFVVVAPAHDAKFIGMTTARYAHYRTPLGDVGIKALPGLFAALPRVFDGEHSLEVQLPFLQIVCTKNQFSVLPLLVGNTDCEALGRVLAGMIADPHTIIIVTSDLSHFLVPSAATAADFRVCRAIEQADYATIESGELCGKAGVLALTRLAEQAGLKRVCLKYGQSSVSEGPAGRVVGYGSFAFYQPE